MKSKKAGIIVIVPFILIISFFYLLNPGPFLARDIYRIRGAINANNYVKEKYGFNPKIKSVKNTFEEPGILPKLFPYPEDEVIVTMKYKDTEFRVEVSGSTFSKEGADDFQKDEIMSYLNDVICEKYPMVKEAVLDEYTRDYYRFSEYFTGDNFQDFLTDSYVILKVVNTDISSFPLKEFFADTKCERINIINYKSEDNMPILFEKNYYSSSGHEIDAIYPFINEYLFYDITNDYEPDVKTVYTKYDNEIIVCTEEDYDVTITPLPSSNANLLEDERFIEAYYVETDADDVWIYVPESKVDDNESIKIYEKQYKSVFNEGVGYTYFDNLVIQDDPSEFNTSFEFTIAAEPAK